VGRRSGGEECELSLLTVEKNEAEPDATMRR